MVDAGRCSARQRMILMAIVANYIETGEPVGSGTIAAAMSAGLGVSAATVRNEMAELADGGLLEQPHTSAGRVPTARAFRMYVEQLRDGAAPGGEGLSASSRTEIDLNFAGVSGTQQVLERTSRVLAALSSGVGLAVTAAESEDTLEHIHFSRLAEARVLAVVVTESGQVRDRVLLLERNLAPVALETAAHFLNERFRGWSLEAVRGELVRLVEGARTEYRRMVEAQQLWAGAVPEGMGRAQTVYVDGVANLIGMQGDGARLRELLSALEAKERLVELLNAYIDARQDRVRVVFDMERQAPEMAGLVLVAAPARMQGESRGAVGVIGTKRMRYEDTMNVVSYMAQVFDRMLRGTEG